MNIFFKTAEFIHGLRCDLAAIRQSLHHIQRHLEGQDAAASINSDQEIELRFPRTIRTQTQLDSQKDEPFEWLKFSVAVITVVAVIAYTALAGFQLVEMRRQLDQMKAGQRPWLGLVGSPRILRPPKMGQNEIVEATIHFEIKNYGVTPALHIGFFGAKFNQNLKTKFPDDIKQAIEISCRAADSEVEEGPYIFPDNVLQQDVTTNGKALTPDLNERLRLVGCIAYQDQYAETIHHTTFSFDSERSMNKITPAEQFSHMGFSETAN